MTRTIELSNKEENMMTREERLAREVLDPVERFYNRRTHDAKHPRHLLRGAVPTAVSVLALLSVVRGLRSRRRGLLPLAVAYLGHRKHSSRRKKRH
jgi:hypothetical protein